MSLKMEVNIQAMILKEEDLPKVIPLPGTIKDYFMLQFDDKICLKIKKDNKKKLGMCLQINQHSLSLFFYSLTVLIVVLAIIPVFLNIHFRTRARPCLPKLRFEERRKGSEGKANRRA